MQTGFGKKIAKINSLCRLRLKLHNVEYLTKMRGAMMQKKRKNIAKDMTITGIVEEFDSIEDGIGILIAADDDENYVVEPNKIGKKLSSFRDERVKVNGLVTKDKDGLKYINVSKFSVFEDTEDYFDIDDDY